MLMTVNLLKYYSSTVRQITQMLRVYTACKQRNLLAKALVS